MCEGERYRIKESVRGVCSVCSVQCLRSVSYSVRFTSGYSMKNITCRASACVSLLRYTMNVNDIASPPFKPPRRPTPPHTHRPSHTASPTAPHTTTLHRPSHTASPTAPHTAPLSALLSPLHIALLSASPSGPRRKLLTLRTSLTFAPSFRPQNVSGHPFVCAAFPSAFVTVFLTVFFVVSMPSDGTM